jgi:hypothetical protein
MKNAYEILVRKPEGNRSLGTARHILEDNIKMDLKEQECEGVGGIILAQDRVQ